MRPSSNEPPLLTRLRSKERRQTSQASKSRAPVPQGAVGRPRKTGALQRVRHPRPSQGSWGQNLALGGWLPLGGCGPAVSPRARPIWVTQTGPSSTGLQELKPTGAFRGACGRREWCTLRWGRLPVPAKGGWSGRTRNWRLAAPAAFQWHPSLTVLWERL